MQTHQLKVLDAGAAKKLAQGQNAEGQLEAASPRATESPRSPKVCQAAFC